MAGKHRKGCLFTFLKAVAIIGALLAVSAFTLKKCENDTGADGKGHHIYSPMIADLVFTGSWLPGAEFTDITFSIPANAGGTTIQATGGLWQNKFNGRGTSAFLEVRPTHRLSEDDWWGQCRIFRKGKNGMELADQRETHTRDAVRCRSNGELPCRENGPPVRAGAEFPPVRLACG